MWITSFHFALKLSDCLTTIGLPECGLKIKDQRWITNSLEMVFVFISRKFVFTARVSSISRSVSVQFYVREWQRWDFQKDRWSATLLPSTRYAQDVATSFSVFVLDRDRFAILLWFVTSSPECLICFFLLVSLWEGDYRQNQFFERCIFSWIPSTICLRKWPHTVSIRSKPRFDGDELRICRLIVLSHCSWRQSKKAHHRLFLGIVERTICDCSFEQNRSI